MESVFPKIKAIILEEVEETTPYLDEIITFADNNKHALGFFQNSVFYEKAAQGKIWIAVEEKSRTLLGYLIYGGIFPRIRIYQLFVSPESRARGIGSKLILDLVEFGERNCYQTVIARVGADLQANKFWEKNGRKLS